MVVSKENHSDSINLQNCVLELKVLSGLFICEFHTCLSKTENLADKGL